MLTESGGIPGRQKVAHGSNVPALTSHASPNPRSKSGYEPERRVIKKDRPEAETRAEDDLELDYERNKKKKSRAYYDSFFCACKSSILSVENIKKGAKNGNKKISSYRRD